MSAGRLVRAVLGGVLGARGKRTRKASRYLTGGRGGSLWSNPGVLLGAAGLAWGVLETLQRAGQGSAGAGSSAEPPPLPGATGPTSGPDASTVDPEALRLVRLAISAAGADGRLSEAERAAIVQQASAAGMGDLVEQELRQPLALADILGDVSRPEDAATLYVMAFTIVRADEQISGPERIYLARLAEMLRLDPATAAALEEDTGERIDALGDQGQPGG